MKKIYTIIAAVVLTANVFAQSPEKMSYQAVVRDASDNLVTNQSVGMQISILQTTSVGTAVYVETQTVTTNTNGLLSIEIGAGTLVSGDFTTIDWGNDTFYIKTETDPTGGSTYTITGTSQLMSVPYALHSKTAESIIGIHYVGELYGGGIVYEVYDNGQHGLIASLEQLNSNVTAPWGLMGTDVPNCESLWDGASNTAAIIAAGASATDAAGLCDAYSAGGFTDWYLPSSWELVKLYNTAGSISKVLENDGDPATEAMTSSRYWSSTEVSSTTCWNFYFAWGQFSNSFDKTSALRVRAVRAF